MSSLAEKERYSSFDDTLSIPGAEVRVPPPIEERVYYVPSSVEAYTETSDAAGRSVEEIAATHLIDTNDHLVLPESGRITVLKLRKELGCIALKYIDDALERRSDSAYIWRAARVLPSVAPADTRLDRGSRIMNDPASTDHDKYVVSRVVPDVDLVDVKNPKVLEDYIKDDPRAVAKVKNREKQKVTFPKAFTKVAHLLQSARDPNFLSQSPLHRHAGDDVKKFRKSGADTYVLPKDLEASIRVIPIEAAAAWLRAFENWPEWFRRGFNYVPIEPIQDIAPTDDNGMVAVTTTNLRGKSLLEVADRFPEHTEQLYAMREEIRSGLTDFLIKHYHLHDENFVVVPYAQDNGRPDLSRCPRLYAIDFDAAETAF